MPDMPTISTIDFGDGVERQLAGGVNTNFTGHKSVWDAMTDEQRAQYDTYDFDDDFNGMPIDAVPTQGSTNPVQSGGVFSAIDTLTNQDSDMVNILGAKNVLPNNATTQVINGVTFTVNSDGSITVNGTATDNVWFGLNGSNVANYSKQNFGNCYLSSGTNPNSEIMLQIYWSDDGTTWGGTVSSRGDDALIPTHAYYTQGLVVVLKGATINNEIVYPMIRPASIADDTYVPYAPTNRNCAEKSDLTSISETGTTASQAIAQGTYFYLNGELVRAKVAIAQGATFTLNTNYEVVTAGGLNELSNIIQLKRDLFSDVSFQGQVSQAFTVNPDDGYILLAVTGVDYWGSQGRPLQVINTTDNIVTVRGTYDADANRLYLYYLEIKKSAFRKNL